ncbi:MAG: hypothetical protein NXY59_01075 [Aigarchaeota archaeon]|nr:hypothetical protein [Candidatus Pelearchaeum maunauluense]
MLRTIMLHENAWISNPILTTYAVAHQLSLTDNFELENSIVRAFVNRLDGIFLVNLSSPRSIKNMRVVKEIL